MIKNLKTEIQFGWSQLNPNSEYPFAYQIIPFRSDDSTYDVSVIFECLFIHSQQMFAIYLQISNSELSAQQELHLGCYKEANDFIHSDSFDIVFQNKLLCLKNIFESKNS